MGFVNRKKSGNIIGGSRLVVNGQNIFNVQVIPPGFNKLSSKQDNDSYFEVSSTPTSTPIITPTPSITPTFGLSPTPSNTPTNTETPTSTPTPTPTPTQTPTNTPTNTITPTQTNIPIVSCSQSYSSGGSGVTEYTIPLDSIGGVILFQFSARNVPDKMEIIHNGVKKSTSGMLSDGNSGPFDSYGVPPTNLPTIAQTYDINQFIGRTSFSTIPPTYYKNIQPIPSRKTELLTETGFDLTLTGSYDQFVWWTYTPSDYIINSNVIIRITGPSGGLTGWDLQRLCPVLPTPTSTPTPTMTPTPTQIVDTNYLLQENYFTLDQENNNKILIN
jgi:hypothetical protein